MILNNEKTFFHLKIDNILLGIEIKDSLEKVLDFIGLENFFVQDIENVFNCKIVKNSIAINSIEFNVINFKFEHYLILFEFRKKFETKFVTERLFFKKIN